MITAIEPEAIALIEAFRRVPQHLTSHFNKEVNFEGLQRQ